MLMLNVWPFVIFAILVAPATPSHEQDSAGKRYFKGPKNINSRLNIRPQDISQDVSKKSLRPVDTFTQKLLYRRATQTMLTKTMESKFMEDMVKGTLTNEQYRTFLTQNAHFLSRGRDILLETAQKLTETCPEFASMYNIQAGKFDTHYRSLLKDLGLEDVEGVLVGVSTADYEDFLNQLSQERPRRLAIGLLPFSQSFRSISGQLMPKAQDSPYVGWFQSNFREPGYESELEKFINRKFNEGIFTDSDVSIYLQGMEKEEKFIEAAGTDLLTMADIH